MRFWSGSRRVERVGTAVRGLGLLLVLVYAEACAKGSGSPASRDSAAAARSTESTAPGAAPTSINTRHTILFAGTSLTAGLGLDPDSAYPMLIQQKIDSAGLPFTVINAGVSGETSSGLLDRLDWLLRGRFDVLVLETGANDGLRGISPTTLKQNLDTALDRIEAKRPDARVLLVQMEALPNLGPQYAAAFHAVYPAVAKEKHVTLLPFLLNGVAGRRELNQSDGVHPNYRGERIVADNMWRALVPVLAAVSRQRVTGDR